LRAYHQQEKGVHMIEAMTEAELYAPVQMTRLLNLGSTRPEGKKHD
jgi:hypothetical protein